MIQSNLVTTALVVALGTAALQPACAAPAVKSSAPPKPRVIATTDGEVDDRSSMIRFLLYTCDFDVAGIVEVNSKYQKNGHSKEPWLENQLAAYEQVLPNLRKHNADYPSAEYLRSVCRVGNENIKDLCVAPPDMETKNTPGAQLIIDTLLDNDPRPVHVLSWGGANSTASALWKLKTEYPKEKFDYAVSRIRIYCIWYQDGGGGWIQTNIPQACINEAYRWDNVWDYQSYDNARGKGKPSANPPDIQEYMKPAWLDANVKIGHGPLGAMTPQEYISEGDTPSFLHLVNNGLNAYEDYTLGGWGGRSAHDNPAFPNHVSDKAIKENGNRNKMYWRWVPAAQNDFAARMDWCVKEYKDANHAPVAKVKGALVRDVKPGETVNLAATATDPDGNKLTYKWLQYTDADSANATVTIANSDSLAQASFVVPSEPGKQVQIILEVTDSGTPPLVGYQRMLCNIK
jgi:Cellulose-binding Sde182, nucleoside hydrolase-like domain/Cellulose-binding protein Sde0182, C-terminal domain